MRRLPTVLAAVLFFAASAASADTVTTPTLTVRPFDLSRVRLLEGPFRHAQELGGRYLLSLDVDRLAHVFRVNAGLPSNAKPLGGWEAPACELRGHFVGHYLSACAEMYAATGDKRFKERGDRLVAILAECQAKFPNGYLSAFPESFIDRVETGQPVWAPWYTLHKIYAGLLDMHRLCGNKQALETLQRAVAWAKTRIDKLDDARMQKMLDEEHGGMTDVLGQLSAVTGKKEHLDLARRFLHRRIVEPLARHDDQLTSLHANTQIPKLTGAAELYERTGDPALKEAASFFWKAVTSHRTYVTGGNSDEEYFPPIETFSQHLGPKTQETCNTHNLLKLTRHLFEWDPRAPLMDYYERALFNHILASQNPATGMMDYYVPLMPGCSRDEPSMGYCKPDKSFWCCTGTGVENHATHGGSIYFHGGVGDQDLYVNLFIASEVDWRERGVRVRQQTLFPHQPTTRLTVYCDGDRPVEMALKIRRPAWVVEKDFKVLVDGRPVYSGKTPDGYVTIRRTWRDGDAVDVVLPMTLTTEGFRDRPGRRAILYGPLVLCAEVDPKAMLPVIVGDPTEFIDAIRPVAGRPLTFAAPSTFFFRPDDQPLAAAIVLIPFYMQYEKPYAVYWDFMGGSSWWRRCKQWQDADRQAWMIEQRTLDCVTLGDKASEKAHGLEAKKSAVKGFAGRTTRQTATGGGFTFGLKSVSGQPLLLLVKYWRGSAFVTGFEALADGVPLRKAAEIDAQMDGEPSPGDLADIWTLADDAETSSTPEASDPPRRPDRFVQAVFPVPATLTHGKNRLTVRIQTGNKHGSGELLECRLVRTEDEMTTGTAAMGRP